MKPKKYIVWSTNKEIDLNDFTQKKWYYEQVLSHGLTEDIAELDWNEIKRMINELSLPEHISKLWGNYFLNA